ncbi:MAG: hypothetical protein KGJ13_03105 [Patescibacteria group bacterium]|nr:hypothetical protein [Patescibacteria group bacterium]
MPIVLSALLFGDISCSKPKPAPPPMEEKIPSAPPPTGPKELTVGNLTYLRLRLAGELDDNADAVMNAYAAFQKLHPEFQTKSYWIDYVHGGTQAQAVVYGIWIEHFRCPPQTKRK